MEIFTKIQNKYSLKYSNGYPCNIGFGASGHVQLAINNHTKELVAVKKISRIINSPEIQLHKKLDHPSIVKCLDCYTSQKTSISFIVMEYHPNGNLYDLINKEGIKDKSKLDMIFKEICLGIEYLHSLGIMHRDLKPQNILLDKYFNPKICDFGSAVQSKAQLTQCGSYEYMAPQILLKREYTNKIDIWSLGIILFQMIQGRAPYTGSSFQEMLEKINTPILFSEKFRASDLALIKTILRANPDHRPSISQIISNFLTKKMNESAETTLNISSNTSNKSMSKFFFIQQKQKLSYKPQIKITSIKLIGNTGYLNSLCHNNDSLEESFWQNTRQKSQKNLFPKCQSSRQLSKTWSKISLKRNK